MQLQSMGGHGELLNVEALRAQWEDRKVYTVAPQGAQITLHLLVKAAQGNVRTAEELAACLAKIAEVLEAVWPTGKAVEMDIVAYGKAEIHIPKAAGQ